MCLDGDYVPIHHSGMSELQFLAKFGMYYIKERVAYESVIVKDSSGFREPQMVTAIDLLVLQSGSINIQLV